jgi:TetR/AcrR family transcriptional regulator, cholesterol catabolism regulator
MTHADGPRGRRSNVRREQILDAAAQLFSVRGYQATSLQDIANEVDLLKGSLYYYFESKQDLLLEVARAAHVVPVDGLTAVLAGPGSVIEKLRRYVEYHIATLAEHPITVAAFYSEMRYLKPEHAREIIAARDREQDVLVGLLATGQEEGSVAATTPPKLLAMAILGLINSIARWYRPDGEWPPDVIARAFADMVVDGLVGSGEDDAGPSEIVARPLLDGLGTQS